LDGIMAEYFCIHIVSFLAFGCVLVGILKAFFITNGVNSWMLQKRYEQK
jgi:hypothetical protein